MSADPTAHPVHDFVHLARGADAAIAWIRKTHNLMLIERTAGQFVVKRRVHRWGFEDLPALAAERAAFVDEKLEQGYAVAPPTFLFDSWMPALRDLFEWLAKTHQEDPFEEPIQELLLVWDYPSADDDTPDPMHRSYWAHVDGGLEYPLLELANIPQIPTPELLMELFTRARDAVASSQLVPWAHEVRVVQKEHDSPVEFEVQLHQSTNGRRGMLGLKPSSP